MSSNSDFIIKPLATAAVAVAIDQFLLKSDMNRAMYLGAAAGVGVAFGGFVGSSLPAVKFGNQAYFGNGKGVTQRVSEIGIGVGASFVINNYV